MNKDDFLKYFEEDGFIHHNHYHIETDDNNELILKGELSSNANNSYGIAHGGFIFGLADTAMGIKAASKAKKIVTLSSNISYLRPGKGNYLIAKPEIIKEGNNICFLKCDIYDDKKQLVANATGSYYYIKE